MEARLPNTKMVINARFQGEHLTYEGETKMSQQQQDYYQSLVGDGKARVSVSRDESEKDYGNGGGIGVTVTLTCGQSNAELQAAIGLAHQLADGAVRYYAHQIRQDLVNRGILQP